jgi:hypothetical protein
VLGTGWSTAMRGPFPQVRFVATGGMDARVAPGHLTAGVRMVTVGPTLAAMARSPSPLPGTSDRLYGAMSKAPAWITARTSAAKLSPSRCGLQFSEASSGLPPASETAARNPSVSGTPVSTPQPMPAADTVTSSTARQACRCSQAESVSACCAG